MVALVLAACGGSSGDDAATTTAGVPVASNVVVVLHLSDVTIYKGWLGSEVGEGCSPAGYGPNDVFTELTHGAAVELHDAADRLIGSATLPQGKTSEGNAAGFTCEWKIGFRSASLTDFNSVSVAGRRVGRFRSSEVQAGRVTVNVV